MPSILNDRVTNKNRDVSSYNNLTKFNVYSENRYLDSAESGTGFIFITKPLLFIHPSKPNSAKDKKAFLAYENMCKDPLFTLFLNGEALNELDKEIVKQLSYDTDLTNSFYLKIFTNGVKNFDPSDLTLDSQDAYDTKQGYRMMLPTHTTQSQASGTLSFNINETKNLDITKMISLWVKYIDNITDGTFHANPDMVNSGVLDYTSSIYYFFLAPDGHTIKYWCKYTGCYPTAAPYSPFRYNKGNKDIVELDLQFNYTIKEDMNPRILEDFNRVSLRVSEFDTMDNVSNLDYTPIRESNLLNYNSLTTGVMSSTVNSEFRDPLVFIRNASEEQSSLSDKMSDRFELSFSKDDMMNDFIIDRFGEENDISHIYMTKLEG